MAKPTSVPIDSVVDDARALYLAFGGRQHRRIEEAMRAKGYTRFSRRVFYDRFERGRLQLGWVRRFRWNVFDRSQPPALAGGMTRTRTADTLVRPDDVTSSASTRTAVAHRTADTLVRPDDVSSSALTASKTDPTNKPDMNHFENWLNRISPGMQWDAKHQKYLYKKLADITSGKTKRLMIFMPPRHGKSQLVSVRYAAWRLRQDPSLNIILGSYSQRLANRFSRKIRVTWEDSTQMDNRESTIENEKASVGGRSVSDGSASVKTKKAPVPATAEQTPANSQLSIVNSSLPSARRTLNTVAEWETGMGGGVRAVGVGAGITGYGAKLVIVDDPVRSRAEAESETYRNRVWEWFNDDLYTRLEPDAAMILIQTRWHEDDLSGRLLQEMQDGGEKWDVVCFPAIAEEDITAETQRRRENDPAAAADERTSPGSETYLDGRNDGAAYSPRLGVSAVNVIKDPLGRKPGDALWPERFPIEELFRIQRKLGSYSFAALYQQHPTPLEGGLFKKSWFKQIIPVAPQGLRWFRGYDLAISTKTSADYTASARCAMDRHGNIYIADVFRARLEYPDQRKFVIDRMMKERDTEHGIEFALHAQAFVQDLRRQANLARFAIKPVRVTSDKFTRALAWANRAEEGKIILVRGPWINTFLEEVCSFPNAPHDDQVDAVSLCVQMLDTRRRIVWRF